MSASSTFTVIGNNTILHCQGVTMEDTDFKRDDEPQDNKKRRETSRERSDCNEDIWTEY